MILKPDELKRILSEQNIKTETDMRGLVKSLTSQVVEAMLQGEISDHLGYAPYDYESKTSDNSRNGFSKKTVKSDFGKLEIKVPRDRESKFEPIIVPKNSRVLAGFEEQIINMYSLGMSQRDISGHIDKIYGCQISADAISSIVESVSEKVSEWQDRSLKEIYTVIFMDAIVFNVKQNGHVKNMAINVLVGIDINGIKEIIGFWSCENESAKFWLTVLNDLKSRGVKDVLIFCIDGLKGFGNAIKATYPDSDVQRCIVHQIRYSTKYINYKERKDLCSDLKPIYQAVDETEALKALDKFSEKWDTKYSYISKSWRSNWDELSTFFKYPNEIRKLIYTTNTIESANSIFRKITKNKGYFNDESSLFRLLYLGLDSINKKWSKPIKNWGLIFDQLCIIFDQRLKPYIK